MASVLGWLTSSQGMAIIGLLITILGFTVNFIFGLRRDRREQALLRAKLAALKSDSDRPQQSA